MKKIIKHVLPIFAFAILALSFSACGKIPGSKYKSDENAKIVISFNNASEFTVFDDGNVIIKGTYKVEKKTITVTGKEEGEEEETSFKFEIQDSKKTKLKDEEGGTWTKI